MQFDGEKPDKIMRGACNDDKVIFENPLNWTTRSFIFREAEGVRKWASHSGAQWRNYRARPRPRKTQRDGALCPGPKLPVRRTYRDLAALFVRSFEGGAHLRFKLLEAARVQGLLDSFSREAHLAHGERSKSRHEMSDWRRVCPKSRSARVIFGVFKERTQNLLHVTESTKPW